MNRLPCILTFLLAFGGWTTSGLGDVLIGTNDERFVGSVIEETADTVVFESEIGGRLVVPRNRLREVQRTAPPPRPFWKPPGVGKDGHDWVELKSGEWLCGWIRYVQDKEVEFDSEELEEMTLKLKDIRTLFTAKPMDAMFANRAAVQGLIVISNELVYVTGVEGVQLARTELIGITPASGKPGMKYWAGKFTVSLSLSSGNTESTDLSLSGELSRRTPNTELSLNYLGNVSEVAGVESENNQRLNLSYDVRLTRQWFVRPVLVEYFYDPLVNIAARVTGGIGGGYYILDRDDLEWKIMVGPAYQYTKYDTVDVGEKDYSATPAAVLYSLFKADITRRVKTTVAYQGMAVQEKAGLYSHHAVFQVTFEIKHRLDLDVAFVWDYLQNPQPDSGGEIPKRSDLRLDVGLGMRF
ncbi:MAG: hypothetical protein PCFJNLEI_02559 [Verrucomicrobiae bacterium]|nr:hypothetical protein [Verrucomicrobiae bacterium]